MDRERLAAFLRTRREALQPEDVGLPRGRRRRTAGLRREEVAVLSDLSVDYYTRLEQPKGPYPSEQTLSALARGLRLTLDERDHVFRLAGLAAPGRDSSRAEHVNPGMMRILDGLGDVPAQVVSAVGETLRQTRMAMALLGDDSVHQGMARSQHYRWFAVEGARDLVPAEDHAGQSQNLVAHLHAVYTRSGASSRAAEIASALSSLSPEFDGLWRQHPVAGPYCAPKRLLHPLVGPLELHCQTLLDPGQSQALVVYTAVPGSESAEKLDLLSVVGTNTVSP